MPCTFDPGEHGRYYLTVYAEDPVTTGVVGFGPSPKEPIVRIDTTEIAKLNRPDEEDEKPPAPAPAAAPKAVTKPTPKSAPAPKAAAAPPPSDVCCVCGLNIKGHGKTFRMEGRRYHRKCFKCAVCKCLLEPSDFYQDANGAAVCEDHVD